MKSLRQLFERGVRHNLLGRNEQILPFLISVCLAPTGRNLAILNTTLFLGYDIRIVKFIFAFDFNEIYNAFGFYNEVRLIAVAMIVSNIKFLRCRTEPVLHIGIIFQYPCKEQFRMAIKLGSVKHTLFDAIEENRLDFFGISRKKADTLTKVVMLFQIIISGANHFLLQESVFSVEVLKHLLVDFVADITLVHHNDILHTIDAVAVCIVVADLRDQLEQ